MNPRRAALLLALERGNVCTLRLAARLADPLPPSVTFRRAASAAIHDLRVRGLLYQVGGYAVPLYRMTPAGEALASELAQRDATAHDGRDSKGTAS